MARRAEGARDQSRTARVTGEATWRVPSLSVADEAVELFTDRARLARPDFAVTDDTLAAVMEICRRSTACRWPLNLPRRGCALCRSTEIVDGLHDRFRLLTGGARTAVRRQQTLRASVDWSHALLTDTERILFRRLAVFAGRIRPRRRPGRRRRRRRWSATKSWTSSPCSSTSRW